MVRTLELFQKSETKNELGKVIYQYVKLTDFEGIIDQLSASEVIAADKLQKESSHVLITFNVALDVKEQDRIVDGTKKYRVQTVDNPMNLNKHLEITLIYEGVVS